MHLHLGTTKSMDSMKEKATCQSLYAKNILDCFLRSYNHCYSTPQIKRVHKNKQIVWRQLENRHFSSILIFLLYPHSIIQSTQTIQYQLLPPLLLPQCNHLHIYFKRLFYAIRYPFRPSQCRFDYTHRTTEWPGFCVPFHRPDWGIGECSREPKWI